MPPRKAALSARTRSTMRCKSSTALGPPKDALRSDFWVDYVLVCRSNGQRASPNTLEAPSLTARSHLAWLQNDAASDAARVVETRHLHTSRCGQRGRDFRPTPRLPKSPGQPRGPE